MTNSARAEAQRKPDHPIEPLFVRRWSPRAMSGEPIDEEAMLSLFEAARWAPSTYNEQEWRFLYGRRDTPAWNLFFDLLVKQNQMWCARAAMLVFIAAKRTFTRDGKPNPVHLFDCGNAFENLALQGTAMNLVVHGMQGFDFEKVREVLKIPEDFAVVAMFAVGKPGKTEDLPDELRQREQPSPRKQVREFIAEGTFGFPV